MLELLERAQPLEAKKGRRGIVLADDVGGELAEAVEVERDGAALCEVAVGPMCDQVRALRIEPGDDERARHQALREGNLVAQRERDDVTALAHNSYSCHFQQYLVKVLVPERGTTSFAASTTSARSRARPRRRHRPQRP